MRLDFSVQDAYLQGGLGNELTALNGLFVPWRMEQGTPDLVHTYCGQQELHRVMVPSSALCSGYQAMAEPGSSRLMHAAWQ